LCVFQAVLLRFVPAVATAPHHAAHDTEVVLSPEGSVAAVHRLGLGPEEGAVSVAAVHRLGLGPEEGAVSLSPPDGAAAAAVIRREQARAPPSPAAPAEHHGEGAPAKLQVLAKAAAFIAGAARLVNQERNSSDSGGGVVPGPPGPPGAAGETFMPDHPKEWSYKADTPKDLTKLLLPGGLQGIPGKQGSSGPLGAVGLQGENGTTLKGPPGPPGIQGPHGPDGDKGLEGLQGKQGKRGKTFPAHLQAAEMVDLGEGLIRKLDTSRESADESATLLMEQIKQLEEKILLDQGDVNISMTHLNGLAAYGVEFHNRMRLWKEHADRIKRLMHARWLAQQAEAQRLERAERTEADLIARRGGALRRHALPGAVSVACSLVIALMTGYP
jgi:hypothetical protein